MTASAVTGIPVEELKKQHQSNQNIRGKRAEMLVFDCAVNCPYQMACKDEKECPYDAKQNQIVEEIRKHYNLPDNISVGKRTLIRNMINQITEKEIEDGKKN